MPHTLILLRHGQSEWNHKNLFTGWVDVRLTEKGIKEAKRAGELLKEHDLLPDVLHTSMLSRAIQTANFALDTADRSWIPVKRPGASTSVTTVHCRVKTKHKHWRNTVKNSSSYGGEASMCHPPD
jgi:bisphosphoglycerate-dependent phosphoglycerate mutase